LEGLVNLDAEKKQKGSKSRSVPVLSESLIAVK